jgi:hypothetical protein
MSSGWQPGPGGWFAQVGALARYEGTGVLVCRNLTRVVVSCAAHCAVAHACLIQLNHLSHVWCTHFKRYVVVFLCGTALHACLLSLSAPLAEFLQTGQLVSLTSADTPAAAAGGHLVLCACAGRFKEACELCINAGQPWRAVSLSGAGPWGPLPVGEAALRACTPPEQQGDMQVSAAGVVGDNRRV